MLRLSSRASSVARERTSGEEGAKPAAAVASLRRPVTSSVSTAARWSSSSMMRARTSAVSTAGLGATFAMPAQPTGSAQDLRTVPSRS